MHLLIEAILDASSTSLSFSQSSPTKITNIIYGYENMIKILKNTNLALIKIFIASKGTNVKESVPDF